MGYIFAASLFPLAHLGALTSVTRWILLWLGLQRMCAVHPRFAQVRPWLQGAIAADGLALICKAASLPPAVRFLLDAVQGALWLYTWYLIYRALRAMEPIYGDLHGRALIGLWRTSAGVWLYSFCVPVLGLTSVALLRAGTVLYKAGGISLCVLRAVWLYRAWRDYTVRARQLASIYAISPEEEEDT